MVDTIARWSRCPTSLQWTQMIPCRIAIHSWEKIYHYWELRGFWSYVKHRRNVICNVYLIWLATCKFSVNRFSPNLLWPFVRDPYLWIARLGCCIDVIRALEQLLEMYHYFIYMVLGNKPYNASFTFSPSLCISIRVSRLCSASSMRLDNQSTRLKKTPFPALCNKFYIWKEVLYF